jgi:GNAT superfamily N-acetyltransferase
MSQDHTSRLRPPEHLLARHDLSAFDSGVPALDDWLKRRALANEDSGASRTYVVCAEVMRVVGYYALASGAVAVQGAPGRVRRNMPDPIPVMVLGRLAVDRTLQGQGLGRGLLRDAILRTLQAASIAGVRALLVHAISDDAKRFYQRCGFAESPLDPMTLMIAIADAETSLAQK